MAKWSWKFNTSISKVIYIAEKSKVSYNNTLRNKVYFKNKYEKRISRFHHQANRISVTTRWGNLEAYQKSVFFFFFLKKLSESQHEENYSNHLQCRTKERTSQAPCLHLSSLSEDFIVHTVCTMYNCTCMYVHIYTIYTVSFARTWPTRCMHKFVAHLNERTYYVLSTRTIHKLCLLTVQYQQIWLNIIIKEIYWHLHDIAVLFSV